jgi:glutaredoxin 3
MDLHSLLAIAGITLIALLLRYILLRPLKQVPKEQHATIKSNIEQTVKSNKVVVYSKTYCPYCNATKSLFKKMDLPIKVIELDVIENGDLYQSVLRDMTNQSTVPSIWVNSQFIGGNSDLQELYHSQKLKI